MKIYVFGVDNRLDQVEATNLQDRETLLTKRQTYVLKLLKLSSFYFHGPVAHQDHLVSRPSR